MSKHTKKKRTPQKSRVKKDPIQYINIFIVVLSVVLLGAIVNIFIFEDETSKEPIQKEQTHISVFPEQKELKKTNEALDHERFEEKTKALEIEYIDSNSQNITPISKKQDQSFVYDEVVEKKEPSKVNTPLIKQTIKEEKPKQQVIEKKSLPKLAIIIDDVSASHQVRNIKNLGFPITMAFLPPTTNHPNSAKIAKNVKTYMVHLPLEASSHAFEEEKTLHRGDSLAKIEKRIKEIQKFYPNTKYINNHTGSKYTADYDSMDKLFKVLKKYDYIFIDSKTISNTPTKELAKKHGLKTFTRNIFLDNVHEKEYIENQLQKAVNIAKQTGRAIAIGHPHKVTIDTLKNAKHLTKGVELIYINQF